MTTSTTTKNSHSHRYDTYTNFSWHGEYFTIRRVFEKHFTFLFCGGGGGVDQVMNNILHILIKECNRLISLCVCSWSLIIPTLQHIENVLICRLYHVYKNQINNLYGCNVCWSTTVLQMYEFGLFDIFLVVLILLQMEILYCTRNESEK